MSFTALLAAFITDSGIDAAYAGLIAVAGLLGGLVMVGIAVVAWKEGWPRTPVAPSTSSSRSQATKLRP